MKLVLLSDIHANITALDTVINYVENEIKGDKKYICAGDVVGYGPDPVECIDKVRGLNPLTVIGNHDDLARTLVTWPLIIAKRNISREIKGLGAVQGIHLAIRRIFGDNSKVNLRYEGERKEPNLDDIRQLNKDTYDLLQRVNAATYEDFLVQQQVESIMQGMPMDDPMLIQQHLLRAMKNPLKRSYTDSMLAAKAKGDEIISWMRGLNHAEYLETELGLVMIVHDNWIEPGSSAYMMSTSGMSEEEKKHYRKKNSIHLIQESFGKWPQPEDGNHIRIVVGGHSHKQGRYIRINPETGEQIMYVNDGTVGMPRMEEGNPITATFAVIDTKANTLQEAVKTYSIGFDYRQVQERIHESALYDKFADLTRGMD